MSKGMYVPKESQPKQGGAAAKARDGEKGGKRKIVAQNKKARHDYAIIDTYEAGLVLTGTEVKSLREGRTSLTDGFVQIDRGEAWLHNAHIPEYHQGSWTNHSARRKRKLLLHREEIDKLEAKSQETGHTIVPLAIYFKDGRAKAEVALARGKKEYDKRQTLREKQDRRESDRAIAAARRRQRGV
ncbi:putative SsrA-binding protein [Streptomyces viridochromogenes Tue57]|nr:putative SsrA-binding protein [Streptomyces viridochromogenes Tue57]